jgi:hypothetical protein
VVRIKNTLALDKMCIAAALKTEAQRHRRIRGISDPEDFPFDTDGNLF